MAIRDDSARRSWRFLLWLGGFLAVNIVRSFSASFALPHGLAAPTLELERSDTERSGGLELDPKTPDTDRYRPITIFNLEEVVKRFPRLAECLDDIRLSSLVFPFKVSPYVLEELIDWQREGSIRDDPFYRLVFPTMDMLSMEHQQRLIAKRDQPFELKEVASAIRSELNPHPAGQQELNAPKDDELTGVQHKYDSTILFFPAAGQTCHAYCTYCFRWAQFIGDSDLKFAQSDAESLFAYLENHLEVSDILFTGGDPMIMKTRFLRRYLEPFTDPSFLPHVQNLRIGTRSLTFWPQRFLTDEDADEVLELMKEIRQVGRRHITIMAHLGHARELKTQKVRQAIRRLQNEAKVVIRSQAPLMRGINDDAKIWSEKWRLEVNLGIVPYYMFLARDTGAQSFFSVPLAEAHDIFVGALRSTSGLCRTVRGPSMSCTPGKVEILGLEEVNGEKAFVLRFVQCRDESWIGRIFFAKYDPHATWYDELQPLAGLSLPWDLNGLPRPALPR